MLTWKPTLHVERPSESLRVVWQRGLGDLQMALFVCLFGGFWVNGFFGGFLGDSFGLGLGIAVWLVLSILTLWFWMVRIEYLLEERPARLLVKTQSLFGRGRTRCYALETVNSIFFETYWTSSGESGESKMYVVHLFLKDSTEIWLTDNSNILTYKRELAWELQKGLYEFRQRHALLEHAARGRTRLDYSVLQTQLSSLLKRSRARLSPSTYHKVKDIALWLVDLLPDLHALEQASGARLEAGQVAFDYLHLTLENYLTLPAMHARIHLGPEDLTPQSQLFERLEQLEQALADLALTLKGGDVSAAQAGERLLERQFGTPERFI